MQTFSIPKQHPVFYGHFPNNPIVPGVLLLAYAERSLHEQGYHIAQLLHCKFTGLVQPEECCCITVNITSETRAKLQITKEESVVMHAVIEITPTTSTS